MTNIPNSFQHPNILIDKLAYFLTPEEEKVLNKAVREILGWQERIENKQAHISLSVFVEGKFTKEGERICYGCGLGLQAVRKALDSLNKYRILVKLGDPTQAGQLYQLQDSESVDWHGLQIRRDEWDNQNAKRTQQATEKSLKVRQGVTSHVTPEPLRVTLGGNVGRNPGVTCDVRGGVTSDVNKETHLQTHLQTPNGVGEKPPNQKPRSVLMDKFIEISGIPMPGKKSDERFWWSSIGEIYELCSHDVDIGSRLIEQSVKKLRQDRLTVGGPESIIKTCRDLLGKLKNSKKPESPESTAPIDLERLRKLQQGTI